MGDKRAKVAARLKAIEERLAALEQAAPSGKRAALPPIPDAERFWALAGLQERLGADAGPGGVVYAGSVSLPAGDEYVWQEGASVAALLDAQPEALVPALAALGHRVRLMLVQAVLSGRRTVGELETLETLGTSGQLYHHLRQLVAAGWLQTAGRGRYAVPAERIVPFLVVLAAVGPSPPATGSDA